MEKEEKSSLEDEVFKALDHQIRRDILRLVGERKRTFTEILSNVEVKDSPTLSYHLRSLSPFIERDEDKYLLSVIGKAAYSLLLKTADYNQISKMNRRKNELLTGTLVIWVAAILASVVLDADWTLTTNILPILAGCSLYLTYRLYE